MRSLIRFSSLFFAITSVFFAATMVFAIEDWVEELTNKPFMLFTGDVSKKAIGHSLVEFKGGKKGDYSIFTSKDDFFYEIRDSLVGLNSAGKNPTIYALSKVCVGESCTIYLKKRGSNRVSFSLIPSPPGYELFNKARVCSSEGGSKKKVTKLLKKAMKEALASFPKDNADIMVYKISGYFLEIDSFLEAKSGFYFLNEEEMVAACDIMLISSGEIPKNIDIKRTADLAWKSLTGIDFSDDFAGYYAAVEAIAYACAKMGEYDLAKEYAVVILQGAQREYLTARTKMLAAKIDLKRLDQIATLYSQKQLPGDVFKASVFD